MTPGLHNIWNPIDLGELINVHSELHVQQMLNYQAFDENKIFLT